MTTIKTLTDDQINALGMEAAEHGDAKMTQLCTLAIIAGPMVRDVCRAAVVRAINYTEAQEVA